MTNLLGQSLGRYHILEKLGQGGMATVYKAYDTRLERDVAVKVLRTELFGQAVLERILKRFEREAKALARLTHPNIVPVIDYGEHEGAPYLVMPYLPGGTLKQRLGKPMPWSDALRLLLPIVDALNYAHQHNILHRDVKPSNILLTENGQPMLTDFGIAKILDLEDGQTLTATGVGVGTPEYMSPEQGLGKPVDARTDVYSLGVVLYEMVTGRKPYTADTPPAILLMKATEPLPRPGQFAPGLPEGVEKILLKALAKKPEDRYQSMADTAAAIERVLSGEQLSAGSHSPLSRGKRPRIKETDTATTIDQATADEAATADQGVTGEAMVKDGGHKARPLDHLLPATLPPEDHRPAGRKFLLGGVIGIIVIFVVLAGGVRMYTNNQQRYAAGATAIAQAQATATAFAYANHPKIFVGNVSDAILFTSINAHGNRVTSVKFSPDGRLLASGSDDTTVKIWDAASRRSLFTLYGHTKPIWGLAFSPDGTLLASASEDTTLKIWNLANGTLIRSLEGLGGVAFSPDGKILASGLSNGSIKLWRVSDGTLLHTLDGHSDFVTEIAFSPDGQILASGSGDGTVRLWQVSDGSQLCVLKAHRDTVWSVAFSPDGQTLASGSLDGTIWLWRASSCSSIRVWDLQAGAVENVIFNPRGDLLMATAGGWSKPAIWIWRVSDRSQLLRIEVEGAEVIRDITFDPVGRFFATASHDGVVRLWGVNP